MTRFPKRRERRPDRRVAFRHEHNGRTLDVLVPEDGIVHEMSMDGAVVTINGYTATEDDWRRGWLDADGER